MSERFGERGRELLKRIAKGSAAEVFEKRGRSRRFELAADGESYGQSVEAGWAVRCGDARRSWFAAGSGELPSALVLPSATAPGLRLPPPSRRQPAAAPAGLDAPLATEAEGRALLAGVARELSRELPALRPPWLRLEEGASEASLISSTGVEAKVRGRSAALRVEVVLDERRVSAEFTARSAAELKPLAVARRVADRLLALAGGPPPAQVETLVLSPAVAARVVEALAPRFVGARAPERLKEIGLGGARASAVTLVDDGSAAAGLLAAPYDGEGLPTGAVTLVEHGRFVRPLVAWWEHESAEWAAGCARRDGWRDVPRHGPTQLYLVPDPARAVGDLVGEVTQGAYVISAEGGVRVSDDGRSFALPVTGFVLAGGRAAAGLGRCLLRGSFAEFLHGVRAVGRDLSFVPGDGFYGSPTLVVDGLELSEAPDAGPSDSGSRFS